MYSKDDTPLILFGAGEIGKKAFFSLINIRKKIFCFIDNDKKKQKSNFYGVPIISLASFKKMNLDKYHIIITSNPTNMKEIKEALQSEDITNYSCLRPELLTKRKRLVQYSYGATMEDVILYNALYNITGIFYIDVGSNDPFFGSVTKMIYDMCSGHGINVDVLQECIEATKLERPRDISLCVGIGDKRKKLSFYVCDGLTTSNPTLLRGGKYREEREVDVVTLKSVCLKYVPLGQEIHFLKVDVEGMESEVLKGMDWINYRPWIVLCEATKPCTEIPTHQEWEPFLLSQGYHFVLDYACNRYYVSDEHRELDDAFFEINDLKFKYRICYANLKCD